MSNIVAYWENGVEVSASQNWGQVFILDRFRCYVKNEDLTLAPAV
jgi:hypothetical protein